MPTNTPHSDAVRAAIDALGGAVAVARALMEVGRHVDLDGLDRDTTTLCAAVLALDRDHARALRPALEALLRQVDGLSLQMARE